MHIPIELSLVEFMSIHFRTYLPYDRVSLKQVFERVDHAEGVVGKIRYSENGSFRFCANQNLSQIENPHGGAGSYGGINSPLLTQVACEEKNMNSVLERADSFCPPFSLAFLYH